MSGLLFYADVFASWIEGLSTMWDLLQQNVSFALNQWASQSGNLAGVFLQLVRGVVELSGLGDLTLLEFILSMMGAGFMFYLGFTIVKWALDVIT